MKMFKMAVVMVCLVTVFAMSAHAKTDTKGGLRYSISVSKFRNRSGWSGRWSISETFGAALTDSLLQTKKFIVLGETDMRREALAEQDLSASGRTAGGKKKAKTGHLTPAQLLVKGEITHFQHSTTGGKGGINIKGFRLSGGKDTAEINAVIYVIDSTTGQVLASKKVVGKADRRSMGVGFTDKDWGADLSGFKKTNVGKAVEAAIDEAVEFLVDQLEDIPWSGSVIMVKGGKVYINRGEREGIQKGRTFLVGESEELRDPDTGELLDESLNVAGKIETVTVKKKYSICSIVEGADKITKGMTVRLP